MLSGKTIYIKENDIFKIIRFFLEVNLKNKSTGNNIFWTSDNYSNVTRKVSER